MTVRQSGMDGSVKTTLSRMYVIALVAGTLLAACERWGSLAEAEAIYHAQKAEVLEIHKIIQAHRELRFIDSTFDPEKTEAIEQFGSLDSDSIIAFHRILELMTKIPARTTRVDRFTSIGGNRVELVMIVIFSRGLAGRTEGVVLKHYSGTEPFDNFSGPHDVCLSLDEPNWYVCQI